MTGEDIWKEYQKLPESEKIKFDLFRLKSKNQIYSEISSKKDKILKDLKSIQNKNGDPYFSEDYLKKIFDKE